jgi:hypothetical protein
MKYQCQFSIHIYHPPFIILIALSNTHDFTAFHSFKTHLYDIGKRLEL